METQISFTIYWIWVIWVAVAIAAAILIGAISYFIGETRGRSRQLDESPARPPTVR